VLYFLPTLTVSHWMTKSALARIGVLPVLAVASCLVSTPARGALLAYEPFTNAPGTAIIGSGGGFGFSGLWQANGSGGVATNTSYALGYTDPEGNTLIASGGAGFFQGLTSANTSMQPTRSMASPRGTNGADGVTTWISFVAVRQGPAVAGDNPYPRGANVPHDLGAGALQKLAIGNSTGAATNTVGLIPQGNAGNLRPSRILFSATNFIVVRIDHAAGSANDSAYLFVNPGLAVEPLPAQADTNSQGAFDFSFDRLRVFAGGNASAAQPYAELVLDEYRIGETFADVTPHASPSNLPPAGPLVITNVFVSAGGLVLAGNGGSAGGTYYVLVSGDLAAPAANWPASSTNLFGSGGDFMSTNPLNPGVAVNFYRVLTGGPPAPGPTPPSIASQPQDQSVPEGQDATFTVAADGTAPLFYQWYFNTGTPLPDATNTSLTIAGAQAGHAGAYSVLVTNSLGSIMSSNAFLTVSPAPVAPFITAQPQSLTVTQGDSADFSVMAGGTSPLAYQWYFNTNTALAGATNALFTIPAAQANHAGTYSVVITNAAGSTTSLTAPLTVLVPPYIVAPPQSQSVIVSNDATFNVTAGGTAPLAYQWYFNTNTPLPNATNAALTILSAQTTNAGAYTVVVANSIGSVTSAVATLTVSQTVDTNGAYFVSPSGNDSDPGTITQPFLTIGRGVTAVGTGGRLYIRSGTYALSSKLTLSRTASPTNRIRIWAYPGETVVIDSTGNSSDGISISGVWYHLKGLTVMKAGHNGINISGHSNIVEFCTVHDNGNTGLHITGGSSGSTYPSYNLILNCDAYLNYDPPDGGDADGFSAKWNLGPGNVFDGCRSWWNSDDGWDLWMGTSPVLITNCWAFWTGTNYWNNPSFNGNANGFKLGGNYVPAAHRLVRSVSFQNFANGIDQNNNTAGLTVDNCTSWANHSANINLNHNSTNAPTVGVHTVRNNLSLNGGSSDSFSTGAIRTSNSWQVLLSPPASTSDLLSVDTSAATAPRQADGSLPVTPFLRPVPGGRLIDMGVIIPGDVYSGAAPEIGAYEFAP
jgi:pectate disaccharide-lyase